jgi:uncharacterized protein YyaL (SSP411 family)
MPNRLAGETSPYLRQHADNPVDWYPWGAEALTRARNENKPILLSVGYAACHWCHVMAHESFEDPDTARVMNELFVNIKVDREERPDIDSIYMRAIQAMSGHGGWPMTVFLTPGGDPFWGGTYFPPDERMGIPSFRRVLASVADAYTTRPDQVAKSVTSLRDVFDTDAHTLSPGAITPAVLTRAHDAAFATYDAGHGGFGTAPKFPPTMLLEFLLAHWARTGSPRALDMARSTFARMAAGGMHDQIGGGFHRYAVDRVWLVPHFEKMLYDNALLARFGAHLWQATGDADVRATTENILRWVAREMTSPEGGFYASLDADSDGHEGLFYTWTTSEIDALLGSDAAAARAWFGVADGGNFEGRSVLHRAGNAPPNAASIVERMLAARAARVRPGLDDKVIAAWNGLMLRGVATCARVFGGEEWRMLATRNAEFLATRLLHDGRVRRIWARGEARINGFLEDHAAVALGFLDVWQLTHDRAWFDRARSLGTTILKRFWDDATSSFYDAPSDHEALIMRPRDVVDNATPSGSSLAAELLLRLAYVTGDTTLTRRAESAIGPLVESMARHPHAFGELLCAADMAVHGATAIAIVGTDGDAAGMLAAVADVYVPNVIIAASAPHANDDLALFAQRDARGAGAAAYVCRGPVCDAPVTSASALAESLQTAPV